MIKIDADSITLTGDIAIESGIAKDRIEFVVRPVTRYIVTRYSKLGNSGNSENCGEFDNVRKANCVAAALAKDYSGLEEHHEVFYKLYSHEYDELEFPNNGLIKVK